MSTIVVTVTEVVAEDVTVVEDQVVVTTNITSGDASTIACDPVGPLTATNIQEAIHQLADQQFIQASAPLDTDTNLQEGDMWYNTADNKLMYYRNETWEEVIISAQLSEDSSSTEYEDINLNGGYF